MPIYFTDFDNFFFGEQPVARKVCPYCGMTVNELSSGGLTGCQHCYEVFSSELLDVFDRVQKDSSHKGKAPKNASEASRRVSRLEELKTELNEAVAREEYERAAALRDKIKTIKEGGSGNA